MELIPSTGWTSMDFHIPQHPFNGPPHPFKCLQFSRRLNDHRIHMTHVHRIWGGKMENIKHELTSFHWSMLGKFGKIIDSRVPENVGDMWCDLSQQSMSSFMLQGFKFQWLTTLAGTQLDWKFCVLFNVTPANKEQLNKISASKQGAIAMRLSASFGLIVYQAICLILCDAVWKNMAREYPWIMIYNTFCQLSHHHYYYHFHIVIHTCIMMYMIYPNLSLGIAEDRWTPEGPNLGEDEHLPLSHRVGCRWQPGAPCNVLNLSIFSRCLLVSFFKRTLIDDHKDQQKTTSKKNVGRNRHAL